MANSVLKWPKFGPVKHETGFRPCLQGFSPNWVEARGFSLLCDGYPATALQRVHFSDLVETATFPPRKKKIFHDHHTFSEQYCLFPKMHLVQFSRRGLIYDQTGETCFWCVKFSPGWPLLASSSDPVALPFCIKNCLALALYSWRR